jgi:hypothetical protein
MVRQGWLPPAERRLGSAGTGPVTRIEPLDHARVTLVDFLRPALGSTMVRMVLEYQAVTLTP